MSQLLQYYKSFKNPKPTAPPAAPTFEDLSIDDNLSELQRLVRYSKSNIGLQRLVHVKMISHIAHSVGFVDTKDYVVPLLAVVAADIEPAVRQHLVEKMALVAKFCFAEGAEMGYKVVLDNILPVVGTLLEDVNAEVRASSIGSMVNIAELIHEEDIGPYVLTVILRLAHDDEKEDTRVTASELLNQLAPCLGPDLCKQFVIPELVSLAEDPDFRVRKAAALSFHNICRIGGEHELFERLMPAFVRLSKDDMYRVRRAVAQCLPDVSKNVSDDIRLGVLIEIYLRLAQDPSRLVKQTVLQQAGIFIATLPRKSVTEVILKLYCSMVANPTGDMLVDTELKLYCAYCFPGVLLTIGGERWKELKELYHTLLQSRNSNAKQTLSFSLHEVAKILHEGGVSVEEELVSVFEAMIQDVETIQIGVIKHLASFLSYLSQPCRLSYLPLLHDILHSTNPFNWRLREHLASQLSELLLLPPRTSVYNTLFPLVMTLLQDPVSCVRKASFKGVANLILMLHEMSILDENAEDHVAAAANVEVGKDNLARVLRSINVLIQGEVFQTRILWLELCHQLLQDLPRCIFEPTLIHGLLKLTADRVPNVRVAVSIVFGSWQDAEPAVGDAWSLDSSPVTTVTPVEDIVETPGVSPWKWLLNRADIQQCVKRLAIDDNDVYLNMKKLEPLFPDVTFASRSCRGMKTAPGGADPVVSLEDMQRCATALTPSKVPTATKDDVNTDEFMSPLSNSSFASTESVQSVEDLDGVVSPGGLDDSFEGSMNAPRSSNEGSPATSMPDDAEPLAAPRPIDINVRLPRKLGGSADSNEAVADDGEPFWARIDEVVDLDDGENNFEEPIDSSQSTLNHVKETNTYGKRYYDDEGNVCGPESVPVPDIMEGGDVSVSVDEIELSETAPEESA